jgi:RNA polymerase sigma factor (sigma-70 family)
MLSSSQTQHKSNSVASNSPEPVCLDKATLNSIAEEVVGEAIITLSTSNPTASKLASLAAVLHGSEVMQKCAEVREKCQEYREAGVIALEREQQITKLEDDRNYKLQYRVGGLQKTLDSLAVEIDAKAKADNSLAVLKAQLSTELPEVVKGVSRILSAELGLDKEHAKQIAKALASKTSLDEELVSQIPNGTQLPGLVVCLAAACTKDGEFAEITRIMPWFRAVGLALSEESKTSLNMLHSVSIYEGNDGCAAKFLNARLDSLHASGSDKCSVKQSLLRIAHEFKQTYGFEIGHQQSIAATPKGLAGVESASEVRRELRRQEFHEINSELVARYRSIEAPREKNLVLKKILEVNHPLVIETLSSFVVKYGLNPTVIQDLIPTAHQAVWECLDRGHFRPEETGHKFSTYMANSIRWACLDELTRDTNPQGRTVSGSLKASSVLNLTSIGGVSSLDSILERYSADPVLDLDGGELSGFGAKAPSYQSEHQSEQLLDLDKLRVVVNQSLSELTPKEEDVIRLRFGLLTEADIAHFEDVTGTEMKDSGTASLDQIGKFYGLNAERIRQIQAKALRKLRHPRQSATLEPFLD